MELNQLIIAIGQSVQDAQKAISNHAMRNFLNQYFTAYTKGESNDAVPQWNPLSENIILNRPDGTQLEIIVPTMTLVHHNTMELDQVKVKINAKIEADQSTGALHAEVVDSNAKEGDIRSEIELTFCRNCPSEGVARVNQEAINTI